MAVYRVPQDVEAEDKLLGPFSFKQFVFLIIAVGFFGIAWALGVALLPLAIIPLPFGVFFTVLALPLRKEQPMEIYIAAVISFFLKPRVRLWEPDGVETLIEVVAPKTKEENLSKNYDQREIQRRLSYLANIVDTHGWSVRGVGNPEATGNLDTASSLQADFYNTAVQAEEDILDRGNTTSRQIADMIAETDQQRREQLMQRMQKPQTPTAQQPTQSTVFMAAQEEDIPKLTVNPYPHMRQGVLSPAGERSTFTPPTDQNQPIQQPVDPGIIDLANNHSDLSIATLQKEADRIHKRSEEAAEEEVVISLR